MPVADKDKDPAMLSLIFSQHRERYMVQITQQLLKGDWTQRQNVICWGEGLDYDEAGFFGECQQFLARRRKPAPLQLTHHLRPDKPLSGLQSTQPH